MGHWLINLDTVATAIHYENAAFGVEFDSSRTPKKFIYHFGFFFMISDIAQQGTGMLAMFVNLDQKWRNDFRIWLKEDMFTARLNIGFQACALSLIHI